MKLNDTQKFALIGSLSFLIGLFVPAFTKAGHSVFLFDTGYNLAIFGALALLNVVIILSNRLSLLTASGVLHAVAAYIALEASTYHAAGLQFYVKSFAPEIFYGAVACMLIADYIPKAKVKK